MEFKITENQNVKIHFLENKEDLDKPVFLNKLSEILPYYEDIGYAGYETKDWAIPSISNFIFGKEAEKIKSTNLDQEKLVSVIKNSIELAETLVKNERINVFAFPTISKFTIEKLNGVAGFTPWKKTILIFINPVENWETALKETICHEYAHTISHEFHKWETLLDSIIFEGLAEHFREKVVGGKRAPWTSILEEKEINQLITKITPLLENKDFETYSKVFFGNEEFKQWTGYSLGYYIVKRFILKTKLEDWNVILKKEPKEIMKGGLQND